MNKSVRRARREIRKFRDKIVNLLDRFGQMQRETLPDAEDFKDGPSRSILRIAGKNLGTADELLTNVIGLLDSADVALFTLVDEKIVKSGA